MCHSGILQVCCTAHSLQLVADRADRLAQQATALAALEARIRQAEADLLVAQVGMGILHGHFAWAPCMGILHWYTLHGHLAWVHIA